MLKGLIPTAALCMLLLLVGGCRSPSNAVQNEVVLGEQFILSLGQTGTVAGEGLSIKFNAVEGDSRCAKGVVCIQAGDARCGMQITHGGTVSAVTLIDKGGTDGYTTQIIDQYKLVFKLTPYPEAGKTRLPGDYKLFMTVNK
jgi:hypothetical protein